MENGKGAPELIPSASRDPADDVRRRASVDEGSGQKEGEGVATPKVQRNFFAASMIPTISSN